ncbi:MAG TPA: DUF3810 domain-containing protein [Clostridia bacterium]|nr:DUF3810 domain-containing protein [Clostridia bacterium]
MKINNELRKLKFILLIPAGGLLVKVAALSPNIVEKLYSRGFYKVISQVISFFPSCFPFSLGEWGIAVLVIGLLASVFYCIFRIVKEKSNRLRIIANSILNLLVFCSVLYFSSVITFDLNYQRHTFSHISGLEVRPSSVNDLYETCRKIMANTNEARKKIKEDSNGVMKLSHSVSSTLKSAPKGYNIESKRYPELGGYYSIPKKVFFSKVLSMMGIQGIHNPFTQEANINVDMPVSFIPSTACHEMAHQRGFAREDEANFIAYLTCCRNPGPDFIYSGDLMALIYSMNALYDSDYKKWEQLQKGYSAGVIRDFKAYNRYWHRYEGPVQKANDAVNNAYLKANNQKDGTKSYGRMVDLLIAKYRKDGLND